MIFNSRVQITQFFGANPNYYEQFDLAGHAGIDVVPTGTDWTVNAGIAGEVVDAYFSPSYGITVITYDYLSKLAVRYAHLEEHFVKRDQWLYQGKPLGKMGDTGNTTGAHLHIHCVPMFDPTTKMYPDNGYKGRFDILPLLKQLRMI